jgi:hypothetical protein
MWARLVAACRYLRDVALLLSAALRALIIIIFNNLYIFFRYKEKLRMRGKGAERNTKPFNVRPQSGLAAAVNSRLPVTSGVLFG